MLEEGIRERIVGTIFECTERHQTIATFQSRRTFFRHTVLDTLYKTDKCKCSQWCLNTKLCTRRGSTQVMTYTSTLDGYQKLLA